MALLVPTEVPWQHYLFTEAARYFSSVLLFAIVHDRVHCR